jgi:hypothetical protein
MEASLTVVTALGLAGSVGLLAWGLALCLRHGFAVGTGGPERTA